MNYLIIKTIMAKKQLKIPFKDGRPCKWVKDVHDEDAIIMSLMNALRYTGSSVDAPPP